MSVKSRINSARLKIRYRITLLNRVKLRIRWAVDGIYFNLFVLRRGTIKYRLMRSFLRARGREHKRIGDKLLILLFANYYEREIRGSNPQ
jgi:hypothetical protein